MLTVRIALQLLVVSNVLAYGGMLWVLVAVAFRYIWCPLESSMRWTLHWWSFQTLKLRGSRYWRTKFSIVQHAVRVEWRHEKYVPVSHWLYVFSYCYRDQNGSLKRLSKGDDQSCRNNGDVSVFISFLCQQCHWRWSESIHLDSFIVFVSVLFSIIRRLLWSQWLTHVGTYIICQVFVIRFLWLLVVFVETEWRKCYRYTRLVCASS